MRVPAIARATAPVRDFPGPNLAEVAHFPENRLDCPIPQERLQRRRLLSDQIGQDVGPCMGGGQGQELDGAARRPVLAHGVLHLNPTTLGDLGRTNRAAPDAAAGLQPAIVGRAVVVGFPDADPLRPLDPGPQAKGRAGFRQDFPGHRLEGEALDTEGHSPRGS